MRVDIVARTDRGSGRGYIHSPLRHQHRDSDRLSENCLAAAVRTSQDINTAIIIEIKVVCDDVDFLAAQLIDRELQIVNISEILI